MSVGDVVVRWYAIDAHSVRVAWNEIRHAGCVYVLQAIASLWLQPRNEQ